MNKITVEQFKEWLKREIKINSNPRTTAYNPLTYVLAKSSQIAEPTSNDMAGLKEELEELVMESPCTPTAQENMDFKNEVQRIICKYPLAPKPEAKTEEGLDIFGSVKTDPLRHSGKCPASKGGPICTCGGNYGI